MDFNPNNTVIRLFVQGIDMEEKSKPNEAGNLFLQAWAEAITDFERYIAAFYVARHQKSASEKLAWFEKALQFALKTDSDNVKSAFPSLYSNIAKCYEDLKDTANAEKNYQLATASVEKMADKGPLYHGTRADLPIGDLLTAGNRSNDNAGIIL